MYCKYSMKKTWFSILLGNFSFTIRVPGSLTNHETENTNFFLVNYHCEIKGLSGKEMGNRNNSLTATQDNSILVYALTLYAPWSTNCLCGGNTQGDPPEPRGAQVWIFGVLGLALQTPPPVQGKLTQHSKIVSLFFNQNCLSPGLSIQLTALLCNYSFQKQRCKEGINSHSKYRIYALFSCHIKHNYFWCNQTPILQMDKSSTKFRTSSFKYQALKAKL